MAGSTKLVGFAGTFTLIFGSYNLSTSACNAHTHRTHVNISWHGWDMVVPNWCTNQVGRCCLYLWPHYVQSRHVCASVNDEVRLWGACGMGRFDLSLIIPRYTLYRNVH